MDPDATLQALLSYVKSGDRVCPRPLDWQTFWESLPFAARTASGFTPSPPLVLAAWHGTSNEAKAERLREHIMWAASHDGLVEADQYLRSLPLEAWHHSNPRKPTY